MTLKSIFASALVAGLTVSTAGAGELADACIAALEAEGRDTSGCTCLEDAIMGDADLESEFTALGEIADPEERYAAASDDAKAVMDSCTR